VLELELLSKRRPVPTGGAGASVPNFQGLNILQKCVAGNPNCGKQLEDCLSGLVDGGIFPH